MPEGDTVHRTARRLGAALRGRALTGTDFRVPALATTDLTGEVVVESLARGKHLLLRIGAQWTLHTHLKMEGSWHLLRPGGRWRRPAHEARVVLSTTEWQAVGFALGVVELLARNDEETVVGHLGPDLLGNDWDLDIALGRLAAVPDRPVGQALLDQRNLAGIGNMYLSEVLFLSGVDPRTPTASVPRLADVVELARKVLRANVERDVQTTTGSLARGRRTWVYGRAGRACLRCGSRVEQAMLGPEGRERATYWCPSCQPPWGN
ncbi:Fpg/Nei family DNA glycosylase [Nocardioides alcanivorans]|uniref:Fpg/Nei family DNA glycosylase n=1 Tax=Nocardioides alcanivorans TaxID=2897352 RepID=UPI001F2CFC8F|nr:DNA-formamidopyrimidine glycosylase family protein [Nocardioides alcanivorans]